MKSIDMVDKNFKIETKINKDDLVFLDARTEPFEIHGLIYENGKFRRLPEKLGKTVSEAVSYLHTNTSGGRVRFKTNSPYVAIKMETDALTRFSHMPLSGTTGFDLYVRENGEWIYQKSFIPPIECTGKHEGHVDFNDSSMREITINFPAYNDICQLHIGVAENSKIEAPTPYKIKTPFVYYGSSITQGACASRPGNTYQSYIERRFDADYINLGFSGGAMGEELMVDYMAELDMSLFILDYDHNAPTSDHLEKTHETVFKAIRKKHPDIPIIMMTRPKYILTSDEERRLEIVKKTYENAIQSGDKNVYFIPGPKLMELCKNGGTVDDCHPNDLGFFSMAQVLGDVIEEILK